MSRIPAMCAVLLTVCGLLASPLNAADDNKLDDKQLQLLKDAKSYLDQTGGVVEHIEKKSADWKVGDAAVQMNDVQGLLAQRDKAAQYLKNVETRLEKLPEK